MKKKFTHLLEEFKSQGSRHKFMGMRDRDFTENTNDK